MAVVACAPLISATSFKCCATLGTNGVLEICSQTARAPPNSIQVRDGRLLTSVALNVIHGCDSS